jgi:hypothetical protein
LGWKLATRLQGWGTDALLESYSIERRPVFWQTADDFITSRIKRDAAFLAQYNPEKNLPEFEAAWQARESDIGSRFQQYEPNYEGSPVVFGPPEGVNSAYGVHSFKARPVGQDQRHAAEHPAQSLTQAVISVVRSSGDKTLSLCTGGPSIQRTRQGPSRYPITLSFAKRVGQLVNELADNQAQNPSYRFHM